VPGQRQSSAPEANGEGVRHGQHSANGHGHSSPTGHNGKAHANGKDGRK